MKEEAMKKIETELASVRNAFVELRKLSLQLDTKNRKEVSKIISLLNKFSFELGKISNLTSVIFSNKKIKELGESTINKVYTFKLSLEDTVDVKLLNESEFYFDQMSNEIEKELLKVMLEPIMTKSDARYLKERLRHVESEIEELHAQIASVESSVARLITKEKEAFLTVEELSLLDEIVQLHDEGMKWIEPRFLSKDSKILEKLYNYGILKRKKRGGIDVYSYRQS
jgi:hypothetical protein